MMAIPSKRVVSVAVLILLAFAVASAATHHFREREDAFRKECEAQRQKLGLTPADATTKYPTPEIRLASPACVTPGGTVEVVLTGKFAADAKFFVENDNVEVVKESVAGNQYRATLRAAPGVGPEVGAIAVMQPINGRLGRVDDAVKVIGRYEWSMDAANGWKVIARAKKAIPCAAGTNDDQYDVSFFRAGESAPFETMDGFLSFSLWDSRSYGFTLSDVSAATPGLQNYQALMTKLADPKLTPAERRQLMNKLPEVQKQMSAEMAKMADPAYAKQRGEEQQRKEQEFGCKGIALAVEGGKVTGEMNCSQKVGRLALTGTVALMK